MDHMHGHKKSDWASCTLCRSLHQSKSVFQKAKQRKIDWPIQGKEQSSPVKDPDVYTSVDDAFATILQYMSTTSKQCKRYHKTCGSAKKDPHDSEHTSRFHTAHYEKAHHRNPLQTAEDVHLVVEPGTYAVTAGGWGQHKQQTHMVHLDKGQTVNLDFVM